MLQQKNPPRIFHDDNGSFTDYTAKALDYARDSFSLASLNSTQDYLYIGLHKQFSGVYVEITTANDSENSLDIEYYNGTTWTDIVGDLDETQGFHRSGFIRWDPNQDDWDDVAVNSVTKFWVRMRPATTFDADVSVRGINIVFSDDSDLINEFPEIMNHLPRIKNTDGTFENATSFILTHQAARDEIIQNIRNRGHYKINYGDGMCKQIEPWDILDVEEVRNWSKYIVLEKIFSNLQSQEGGLFFQKRIEYAQKAEKAGNLFWTSLDLDDDGQLDIEERLAENLQGGRLIRR